MPYNPSECNSRKAREDDRLKDKLKRFVLHDLVPLDPFLVLMTLGRDLVSFFIDFLFEGEPTETGHPASPDG